MPTHPEHPLLEEYELVKESRYKYDNIDSTIKSRIYRIVVGANTQYMWDVNYYCRQENEAGVYIPSAPFANSLDEIEAKLQRYMQRFETAVEWIENKYF